MLSITIVNLNTRDLIAGCLSSVNRFTKGISYEIVVVDNGSKDGSVSLIEEKFPEVILIKNSKNEGFAKAQNQAFRVASGKYIAVLNSDTQLKSNAFGKMIQVLERHEAIGAMGPAILNKSGKLELTAFKNPSAIGAIHESFMLNRVLPNGLLSGRYARHWYEKPFEPDWLLGACILIRREAITDNDLFDEDFFFYCEDIEMCNRLKQDGWKVLYFPGAEVVHLGSQTDPPADIDLFVEINKSRNLYFLKQKGHFYMVCFRLVTAAGLFCQISGLIRNLLTARMSMTDVKFHLKRFYTVVFLI